MKKKLQKKFFVVNPKSYMYGEELLCLAKEADFLAQKYENISIFLTAPYADLYRLSQETRHIIVTAQHMDGMGRGRGMGAVLPHSLRSAGVEATFLNHAERPLSLVHLIQAIEYAKKLEILTIVCADSLQEAQAIATLEPDILLCEPTELIGTSQPSDLHYIQQTQEVIKSISPETLVMQAAGITNADDVYRLMQLGADGTGATSGIFKADNPLKALKQMIEAIHQAMEEVG